MDEAGARALMERLSVTDLPPSLVDIGLARRHGARRLRWRRWGLAGAPLVAAAAVVAVILGAEAITSPGGGRGPGGQPAPPVVSAHAQFNPLAPYAAFGWLPKGDRRGLNSPASTPSLLQLTAGTPAKGQFMLSVWAPGACSLDPARAQARLRDKHHPTLNCQQDSSDGWAVQLSRPGPTVAGRPSFWFDGSALAWAYTPHAWAALVTYKHGTPVSGPTLAKVAARIRYAATRRPSVKFPFQFTGLPASWRVLSDIWRATPAGLLVSTNHQFGSGTIVGPRNGNVPGVIGQIVIQPGTSPCPFFRGANHSQRVVLHGVTATVTHFANSGAPAYQGLCIPETNGLHVAFLEFRQPGQTGFAFGGVTGIFLHHLRLIGPDPAAWTTHPLG